MVFTNCHLGIKYLSVQWSRYFVESQKCHYVTSIAKSISKVSASFKDKAGGILHNFSPFERPFGINFKWRREREAFHKSDHFFRQNGLLGGCLN